MTSWVKVPDYAILSHTWGDEEVTIQNVISSTATNHKGYQKLVECCIEAEKIGVEYVWIYTCCSI